MTRKGGKKNVLSQGDLIRLSDWLRKMKDYLQEKRPSYVDVGKQASEILGFGFPINPISVKKIAKVAGVEWNVPRARPSMDRLERIESVLAEVVDVLLENIEFDNKQKDILIAFQKDVIGGGEVKE